MLAFTELSWSVAVCIWFGASAAEALICYTLLLLSEISPCILL